MAVNHTEAMPPQLRAARVRKQRVIKAIILTFTLLFLSGFLGGENVICPFQRHV